jgi:hypothetical protein
MAVRLFDELPAKNTVFTLYLGIYGSGRHLVMHCTFQPNHGQVKITVSK